MTRAFDRASLLPSDKITPHIVPDVLYPAIGGKLLDGTTSHSGNYGTAQSDSRKYYYTDIKGSGPIRDPRIGAHFGSQRHKFKSIQLLEQETATHGSNVYSVDGREWIRVTGANVRMDNDSGGLFLITSDTGTASIVEITGYFNDINVLRETYNNNKIQFSVDGGSTRGGTLGDTSVSTPLGSRYVDKASVLNLDLPTTDSITLGIHTIAIFRNTANDSPYFGVELIVQDTTNAVTRNKIQIPSQTVFSFGSKFTVGGSSAATHYDPFSAKSDGTGWTSPTSGTNNANSSAEWPSNIDTATSLGLAKWVDGTNYYRPYNGGRVVKWVDENGEIKTSVTVMPPNAKSIADSGTLSNATAKSNGSAPNDNFRPTFEAHTSSADEDLLSEVAKTFHWREFGNGAANGGTGGTYADASMLYGVDDIAYVMDDGLTSMSGDDVESSALSDLHGDADGDGVYITFIGTGITIENTVTSAGIDTIAQNLFYGTHILKYYRDSGSAPEVVLDGVTITTSTGTYGEISELTFHQPKMPPIPEGACIIADYMLMADFVAQSTTVTEGQISKGVRVNSASRDHFYDGTSTFEASNLLTGGGASSFQGVYGLRSGVSQTAQLPFFGTRFLMNMEGSNVAHELTINGTSVTEDVYDCSANNGFDLKGIPNGSVATLGLNTAKISFFGSNLGYRFWGTHVDNPIHTSHHYKSFETPFLHELIGGDRNMEQTHLICSADGKTWDEVTRDTSYIGSMSLCQTRTGSAVTSHNSNVVFDDCRGNTTYDNASGYGLNLFNKDFAIAYDRFICLRDGEYEISTYSNSAGVALGGNMGIQVNTTTASYNISYANPGNTTNTNMSLRNSSSITLNRGDYIRIQGRIGSLVGSWIQIKRLS